MSAGASGEIRRIAPKQGVMDSDRFEVAMSSRRGPMPAGLPAALRWWRGVAATEASVPAEPTLALCGYSMRMDHETGRRTQRFDMCLSDTLRDDAVRGVTERLAPVARDQLLKRGYPGAGRAHGHPFRLEIVALDRGGRVMMTPMGGVCLPVSPDDGLAGTVDLRALTSGWIRALTGRAAEGVGAGCMRMPVMTHSLTDGVWRLLCIADLRRCLSDITAREIADAVGGGDDAVASVPTNPEAIGALLRRAAGGGSIAARVTADYVLAVADNRL